MDACRLKVKAAKRGNKTAAQKKRKAKLLTKVAYNACFLLKIFFYQLILTIILQRQVNVFEDMALIYVKLVLRRTHQGSVCANLIGYSMSREILCIETGFASHRESCHFSICLVWVVSMNPSILDAHRRMHLKMGELSMKRMQRDCIKMLRKHCRHYHPLSVASYCRLCEMFARKFASRK